MRAEAPMHDVISCQVFILAALTAAMEERSLSSDGWVEVERSAVAAAASGWAEAHGYDRRVTTGDVERLERSAVGHVDYARKLALYVAEFTVTPTEGGLVEFTVEGVFTIRGRGPVISSKAGVPAGTFTPGGYAECGSLRALVKGVERNGSLRQRQHGILLDIAVEELAVGQVWRPVPEEGTCPV